MLKTVQFLEKQAKASEKNLENKKNVLDSIDKDKAVGAAELAGGTGLAASALLYKGLKNPGVNISYGATPGKHMGHYVLAQKLQELLTKNNIESQLFGSMDRTPTWIDRLRNDVHVDTGWGSGSTPLANTNVPFQADYIQPSQAPLPTMPSTIIGKETRLATTKLPTIGVYGGGAGQDIAPKIEHLARIADRVRAIHLYAGPKTPDMRPLDTAGGGGYYEALEALEKLKQTNPEAAAKFKIHGRMNPRAVRKALEAHSINVANTGINTLHELALNNNPGLIWNAREHDMTMLPNFKHNEDWAAAKHVRTATGNTSAERSSQAIQHLEEILKNPEKAREQQAAVAKRLVHEGEASKTEYIQKIRAALARQKSKNRLLALGGVGLGALGIYKGIEHLKKNDHSKTAAARHAEEPTTEKTDLGTKIEALGLAGAAVPAGLFYQYGGTRMFDMNATPRVLAVGGPKPFSHNPYEQMDSFSAQSQAMARGLREIGLNVDHVPWQQSPKHPHEGVLNYLKHLLNARKYDAVVSTGHGFNYPREIAGLGKVQYRQNSDFNEGNFLNSKDIYNTTGIAGQDAMAVREDVKKYTRFLTPSREGYQLPEHFQGQKPNVSIGNIPVSPAFHETAFSEKDWSPTARKKAVITLGGGNAAPQVFDELGTDIEHLTYPGARRKVITNLTDRARSYDFKKRFFLDDIVEALNEQHPEGVDIDFILGAKKDVNTGKFPTANQWGRVPEFYDDFEKYLSTPEGQARFKGLKLIDAVHQRAPVGQPSMASNFADSHYVFAVPGSTAAEIMAMPGGTPGKIISVLPNDNAVGFMKHFPVNSRELMQSNLPNTHEWPIADARGRKHVLKEILKAEIQKNPKRTEGFKTNFGHLRDIIKNDVNEQKVKNIKNFVLAGGLSIGTMVLGKVVNLVEKYRNSRIDERQTKQGEEAEQHGFVDKLKNISPYLAAGIPLTLATGLALPAAIPAARMGVRGLLANYKRRPYLGHEFVDDYINSSVGVGKTVYKHPVIEGIVRAEQAKNPGIREHWEQFTNSRETAFKKWLDEVKAHVALKSKGAIRRFDRDLASIDPAHLDAANVQAITETKAGKNILTRMAAQKEKDGLSYGKKGLIGLGLFGVGTAATGKGVYDTIANIKKQQVNESSSI
jgi:hypothetical protein